MIRKGWLLFLAVLLTAGFAGETFAADVELGGEVRFRAEFRDNADFDDTIGDSHSFVGQRTRLTANATVSDNVSAKITLQDTRNWGTEAGTADTAAEASHTVDLHEGYLQVGNLFDTGLTLKAGRQKIVKGDQRILGGFEWSNHARAFDAIALVHSNDTATVTAAWVKLDENNVTGVGGSDNDVDLYVAYAEVKSIPDNQLDVYAILARDGAHTGGIGPLATSLWTLGARLAGNLEDFGVDYTVEIPFQFGDTGDNTAGADGSFSGWALAIKGGYTIPGDTKVRIGAEYNLGSGDDPVLADSDEEGFIDMGLGTNHLHYGYMDLHGNTLSNRTHWNVNAKANVTPELSVYGAFWGHKITEVGPGVEDDLGTELNLQASYKLSEGANVLAGYGRGFAGDALGTTAEDQDWAFVMVGTKF